MHRRHRSRAVPRVRTCLFCILMLALVTLCTQCFASGLCSGTVCAYRGDLLVGELVGVLGRCALSAEGLLGVFLPPCAALGAKGEEQDISLCVQQVLFECFSPFRNLVPLRARVVGVPACFRCQGFSSVSLFAAQSSVGRESDGCYSWSLALVESPRNSERLHCEYQSVAQQESETQKHSHKGDRSVKKVLRTGWDPAPLRM